MALTHLILGGNSGDKSEMLVRAIALLEKQCGKILATSSVYETEAWGYTTENTYYNQAVSLTTEHAPLELLRITQEIEKNLGRKTKSKDGIYSDRPIDIDILFFDHRVVNLPELTIPHPHICERIFVLKPLEEIAADFKHPIREKTISQLTLLCKDKLAIKKL